MDCKHYWIIDNHNVGRCKNCGAVAQFDWEGKKPPIVIREGDKNMEWESLSGLTAIEKAEIARRARGRIKEVAEETGIPWTTIRAWIGAYCRGKQEPEGKEKVEPEVSGGWDDLTDHVEIRFNKPFPQWDDQWSDEIKVAWLRCIEETLKYAREKLVLLA